MSGSQASCPSGRFWRVQPGDTFYTIAGRLGLDAVLLEQLNPGVDPHNLQVGSSLCLPQELPPCNSGIYWRVAPGDTLFTIAQATGTTVNRLLELNPGVDPLNLPVNQSICLPVISKLNPNAQVIERSLQRDP